jgi:hypothetical protein
VDVLVPQRLPADHEHMPLVVLLALGWLLLSVLTAGAFAAICHGAQVLERKATR